VGRHSGNRLARKSTREEAAGAVVVRPADGPEAMLASFLSLPGVRGVLLSTKDAVSSCAALPQGVYKDTVAIMSATMFGAAATAARESLVGEPRRLTVHSEDGGYVIVETGRNELATLFTSEEPEPVAELAVQVLRQRG